MSPTADGGEHEPLAPVIPLFGGREEARDAGRDAPVSPPGPAWDTTWSADGEDDVPDGTLDEDARALRDDAEQKLLRKLRTRQLSVSEARAVLIEHGVDRETASSMLHTYERRGYLDDRSLADQLVHSAVERKGQGRHVIARDLSKRGIRRDVIDAALADLPDDDAERALEFARRKAPAMRRLDHDVALRRLAGQLARRGYGAAALNAARTALDEL